MTRDDINSLAHSRWNNYTIPHNEEPDTTTFLMCQALLVIWTAIATT